MTNNTERARITTAGEFQIKGSGEGGPFVYRDGGNGPDITLHGSRGTIASPTASAGTDLVGNINFAGYDGSSYHRRATINGRIDGTVDDGTNSVPTALTFTTGTTAASESLRISSAGLITSPRQARFWAKSNAAQTLNSNSANIIKNYQNVVYNIGNHYDGTNKFTAPVNGYYHFGWSFMIQGSNADTFTYLFGAPLISGNDIAQEIMSPRSGGATYVSLVGSHVLYLTAGQYVQIRMRQSGGSNVSVRQDQAYFWGYLQG